MVIDRGWGKAAQLVAVDGEIRQLVEVKLNVVHVERKPDEPKLLTNVLTNPEKPNDINAVDRSATGGWRREVIPRRVRVLPRAGGGGRSGRGTLLRPPSTTQSRNHSAISAHPRYRYPIFYFF